MYDGFLCFVLNIISNSAHSHCEHQLINWIRLKILSQQQESVLKRKGKERTTKEVDRAQAGSRGTERS